MGKLDRREFLKTIAAVAAIPGAIPSSASPGTNIQTSQSKAIPVRTFGKTGLKLPILGYGGAALPRLWGNPLSIGDRVKLVRTAYDRGVRYFDTAGDYMESQLILGEGLKGIRDKVFLVTKVETTEPSEVRGAVERSLKELQTDYLDAILIHGTPGLEQMTVKQALKIHSVLVKLQNEKITRFIGLSAHSYFDKALALISSGGFDLCMLSYGYIPRGYDQIFSARMTELRNACVAKANEAGMGLAAMKVMGGGILGAWSGYVVPEFDTTRLKKLPGAAIRYVLDDERFHLLVVGMRLPEELDANIKTLSRDLTYTTNDRALLTEYCTKAYESDAIKAMKID